MLFVFCHCLVCPLVILPRGEVRQKEHILPKGGGGGGGEEGGGGGTKHIPR